MNDQPTPETERIKGALHTNWNDLMNHARKLERERDEAWEDLASREVVIAQQNVITDLILEYNTALEALMKIEEVFIDSDDTYEDLIKVGNIARSALGSKK